MIAHSHPSTSHRAGRRSWELIRRPFVSKSCSGRVSLPHCETWCPSKMCWPDIWLCSGWNRFCCQLKSLYGPELSLFHPPFFLSLLLSLSAHLFLTLQCMFPGLLFYLISFSKASYSVSVHLPLVTPFSFVFSPIPSLIANLAVLHFHMFAHISHPLSSVGCLSACFLLLSLSLTCRLPSPLLSLFPQTQFSAKCVNTNPRVCNLRIT